MEDFVFILIALVGFVAHYLKQWAMGNTGSSFWAYMFVNEPKHSLAAFLTFIGAVVTFLATEPAFAASSFYAAFWIGFGADTLNKG